MANEKKSIIEEALLEAEQIDATFKSNAKEILAHTMSSEIEEMVKESLTGSKKRLKEDEEEEETDLNLDLDSDDETEDLDLELDTEEGEDEGTEDLNLDLDSEEGEDEGELEIDSEEGTEDLDLDLGGEDEFDLGSLDLGGDNADLDLDLGGEEGEMEVDAIDLTGASDSDVISVFKKMGPEDEIEVINDNGTVTLKDNESGSEYRIELNTGAGVPSVEAEEIQLGESEEEEDSEEIIYEIEVDDEDEMSDYMDMEDDMSYMEDEDWGSKKHEYKRVNGHKTGDVDGHYKDYEMDDEDYMSRTLGAGRAAGRNGLDKPRAYKDMTGIYESVKSDNQKLIKENTDLNTKNSTLETENQELKENHEKMVDALKQFRKKLQEVAVFNSNLTYAVRLFTENSTTKEEKNEILKRLDSAKTLKESQSIYKQLVKEYSNGKAPIKESVEEKINKTASSGAQISEQSVFVHPELQSMKKLWEYSYKK